MKKNHYFAYRSFSPETEAHRDFNSIGVETVCFFASNTVNSLGEPYCQYPPIWVGEGKYEFEAADAQMRDLMDSSPSARFICMVDLNTPFWLSSQRLKMNSFNQLGRLCSDPEWRRITLAYMESFLEYMETTYPEQIVAYVLACGSTSEWYDRSDLTESPSRTVAWGKYLETSGRPAGDVPGLLARNHVSFDNLLRDPETDGEALEYINFCADAITDTIKLFLKEAKAIIRPEVELGVFHGYPLCLCAERGILGNNDCSGVLEAPELDFVITPVAGDLFGRIGDGGGDLGPTESVTLHKKRYLRECDHKTHCMNTQLTKYISVEKWRFWHSESETLAGLKRELAYTIIKQASCWWFDMWGGFYNTPAIMALLAQGKKLYDLYIDMSMEAVAEVALIVDPRSIYYLNHNYDERLDWFYIHTKKMLDHLGAPYECYNFCDIPAIPNPERIKLWILPAVFELTPDKRAVLDRYVRCRKNTALYMYAPGISDGRNLEPKRVRELCGCEFATPGFNIAEFEDHRAAYVASGPELTAARLKQLARQAGVHIYSDFEQPVYANRQLIGVHTACGGLQTIRLPQVATRVTEVFSGRVVAGQCREFEYTFEQPDTGLFKLEF